MTFAEPSTLGRADAMASQLATGIDGSLLADHIAALGATHIVCVPDTNLKTAIAALHRPNMPRMLYVCTEDEAVGVNAGLFMTGHRPLLMIQNNGFYACLNTVKAIALDARVPTCMVIGEYARNPGVPSEQNESRQVRMLRPTLRTWDIGIHAVEGPNDLGRLKEAWDEAWSERTASAAVIGAATI